jgi:hypothetical protein
MEAAWIGLLGTLGGTLIGGAIGFLGPWLLQRRKEAEEKRRRRAEKFEELVAAVYEFDHWVENRRRKFAYGEENLPETASPFAKIEALVVIYFPQFTDRVTVLDLAFDGFRIWMNAAGIARLADPPGWLSLPEFSNERFNEASRPYTKARLDLLSALKKYGNEEFAKI